MCIWGPSEVTARKGSTISRFWKVGFPVASGGSFLTFQDFGQVTPACWPLLREARLVFLLFSCLVSQGPGRYCCRGGDRGHRSQNCFTLTVPTALVSGIL